MVNFDSRAFERDLMKAAESGVKDLAKQYERLFASLGRRYTGKPVSTIKPVLKREWARINGGSISDPELTEYATLISQGTKIQMQVKVR